jgi:DNA topoisomerase VI subunit B
MLYFSNEEGERMNKAVAENPVLSTAKEIESAFWADAREKELYFQHQRLLMDEYSAQHTFGYLLPQAEEKATQEQEKAEQKIAQVARNLLGKGIDTETIIQTLGLSREDVEKLR